MATPVFPEMTAAPFDSMQVLLVKIAYYLQTAAEAGGATDATMPFPTMVAGAFDSQQVLLVKIAYWASQIAGGGSGSGLTFSTGAGSPEGVVSGSPGDTYWDTTNDFYYVKVTGAATNTGWEVH